MMLAALAAATTLIPWGDARPYDTYYAALKQHCPAKRLDWLSPGILTEELLVYPVRADARRRMRLLWRTKCPEHGYDSGCRNAVPMHVLIEERQFDGFVESLCRTFDSCTEAAMCERYTPAPAK